MEPAGDDYFQQGVGRLGVTNPQYAKGLEIAVVVTRLAPNGEDEPSCTRQVGPAQVVHPDPGGEMPGQHPNRNRNRACTDEGNLSGET